jgi:hypothetical protein
MTQLTPCGHPHRMAVKEASDEVMRKLIFTRRDDGDNREISLDCFFAAEYKARVLDVLIRVQSNVLFP